VTPQPARDDEESTTQGGGAGGPADGASAGCRVRLGDPGDAPQAAAWHAELIPQGFLSSLGERLLRRLYGRVVRSPGSFLLMAEAGDDPAGFIAGTTSIRRLYRDFAVRDGMSAFAGSAPRLVASWPRAVETLRHGRDRRGPERVPSAACGELLAMAVDPAQRGRGIGRMLVDGFLDQLSRRGTRCARVVVGADNIAAVSLYGRAGFRTEETFELHRGSRSLLMTRTVSGGRS